MKCSSQDIDQRSTFHQPLDQFQSKPQSVHRGSPNLATWLNKLGRIFAILFIESYEIRVWQRTDRNGQIWWYAYNPSTGRSGVFDSESEVRVWIEQQFHV